MAWKAKVLGTLIGIGGAMLLMFYKGVQINMGSTHLDLLPHGSHGAASSRPCSAHHLLSALLALGSCISYAPRLNIQGILASGLMFTLISLCVRMRGLLYASVFNPLMLILVAFASSLFHKEKL